MFNRLLPDQIVKTIFDIDLEELRRQNVKGIITDLDNTLVGAHTELATPELVGWLDLLKELGFKVIILSNNKQTRVSRFAAPLGIPFIHRARKPTRTSFHRALGIIELEAGQAVVVGDQMLTDILGGRRAGLHTILVTPIALAEESWTTRINRRIEKVALARLRKKGLWPDKGEP